MAQANSPTLPTRGMAVNEAGRKFEYYFKKLTYTSAASALVPIQLNRSISELVKACYYHGTFGDAVSRELYGRFVTAVKIRNDWMHGGNFFEPQWGVESVLAYREMRVVTASITSPTQSAPPVSPMVLRPPPQIVPAAQPRPIQPAQPKLIPPVPGSQFVVPPPPRPPAPFIPSAPASQEYWPDTSLLESPTPYHLGWQPSLWDPVTDEFISVNELCARTTPMAVVARVIRERLECLVEEWDTLSQFNKSLPSEELTHANTLLEDIEQQGYARGFYSVREDIEEAIKVLEGRFADARTLHTLSQAVAIISYLIDDRGIVPPGRY